VSSVLLLPGDGIGPEVTAAARVVLEAVRPDLSFTERPVGLAAIHELGAPYEPDLFDVARSHDAVLFGAAGGPAHHGDGERRPEEALFALRRELDLYANIRPIRARPALASRSPLREALVEGTDFLLVRELTGGLYYGEKRLAADGALDTCAYSRAQVVRIVERAFELARSRRGRLASIDKANVLVTSTLWRAVVEEVGGRHPDVEVEHLLVDNAAMQLLLRAPTFDVVVTENLFGDILSDEAALLAGGLGMLPSASFGVEAPALYEPAHGSAPDIAGTGRANPCASILSAALLLRHSLDDEAAAAAIERAVDETLTAGILTPDLGGTASTDDVTRAVTAVLTLDAATG
jgi:3-isopropylmalate dehydrogenase